MTTAPPRLFASRMVLLAVALFTASTAAGEESKDVVFSTKYSSLREPTTADFYYNGRAVGNGREAFAEIVDRIRSLPRGTSIVWGPNYGRNGAGSGGEKPCVPKFLYPALWKDLESSAERNGLFISSDYPRPWLDRVPDDNRGDIRAALDPTVPRASEHVEAILDWEIGPELSRETLSKLRFDPFVYNSRQHVFSVGGAALDDFGLDLFFGRLPEDSRLLVRVSCENMPSPAVLADGVFHMWQRQVREQLRLGNLMALLAAPPEVAAELRNLPERSRLVIDWSNFHGPETPQEGVLYYANSQYVGHGDEGFKNLLAAMGELPEGAEVVLPQYGVGGRWAMESMSERELEAINKRLAKVVPFAPIRAQFETQVENSKLDLSYAAKDVWHERQRTVMEWNCGDRYGEAFVSFGRIVGYLDWKRPTGITKLAWTAYEAKAGDADKYPLERHVESEAIYTVNDVEMGQGVDGFSKAMEKLGSLKENSVVQVRVCIRTKPPFTCPITFQGHRHFERTGFEPYVGMFPWLIDVARKHKLQIEWIPDERESCQDCALNK